MVVSDYYGGTNASTRYDYDLADTTTTGSNGWVSYTTGTASSATIIKDYEQFMWKASKVYTKAQYGNVTGEDYDDLVCRAWSLKYGKTTTSAWTYNDSSWTECREVRWERPIQSPQVRLREIIRSRQAPLVITSRKSMPTVVTDVREVRARETLLRVLGEDKFKRFLKDGFVSVKAKSGLVYQIFPGHGITNVYDQGEQVERLCVVLKGNFPPTDSLIMRYLLILNDERDFRSHAIKHTVIKKRPKAAATIKAFEPITEVWNRLKVVA